ncbi:MAG TPA: hypothetical protein VF456_26430 [Vicinamibacterales bacterium]
MIRLAIGVVLAALGLLMLVPILLFMAPFVVVWAAHRAIVRWIEPEATPDHHIVEFAPVVGWRPRARLKTHALADDLYRISTDGDGWRGSLSLDASQIVVFGDSFAFGHAASDQTFFAGADPSLRIKAIGADGYNLVQELIWMRRLSARLSGKLIVWFIFLGNDIFESLQPCMEGYRTPFVRKNKRSGEWEIVTNHVDASPWPSGFRYYESIFMEQFASMFTAGPAADRLFDACQYLFSEAHRTIDGAGGRLVILSVPARRQLSEAGRDQIKTYLHNPVSFDADLPDKRLQSICRKLGIPFVAGQKYLDLDDYLEHDAHWNTKGHRRIANLLGQLQQSFGPSAGHPVPVASPDSNVAAMASAIGHR